MVLNCNGEDGKDTLSFYVKDDFSSGYFWTQHILLSEHTLNELKSAVERINNGEKVGVSVELSFT